MHTLTADHGTVFNYNLDLSGDVIVRPPRSYARNATCGVPAEDLLQFVGTLLRDGHVSRCEQMDWTEFLGGVGFEINRRRYNAGAGSGRAEKRP